MTQVDDGWEIPLEGWKFSRIMLDRWACGEWVILRPNAEFPPSMPISELKRRLHRAALLRDTTVQVWPIGDGRVRIFMGTKGPNSKV